MPSIGDFVAEAGKPVGVISTARITRATPGAMYASAADRNFETDSNLPDGCTVPDIAKQLFDDL